MVFISTRKYAYLFPCHWHLQSNFYTIFRDVLHDYLLLFFLFANLLLFFFLQCVMAMRSANWCSIIGQTCTFPHNRFSFIFNIEQSIFKLKAICYCHSENDIWAISCLIRICTVQHTHILCERSKIQWAINQIQIIVSMPFSHLGCVRFFKSIFKYKFHGILMQFRFKVITFAPHTQLQLAQCQCFRGIIFDV